MNIIFKKLILHNFLSFGHAEIDLDNLSYTLISGINNCKEDLAKSNGAGKSSLSDGIIWALTGQTIRGSKDIVNKFTSEGAYVELDFTVDKNEYKLIRYKDYSNIGTNLKIYINNEDKSGKGIRDTEKLLEQYLPELNNSLISSVIILGQGLPQRFTNNTPAGRKEVLEKLSKSDYMIEHIKEKLSDRKVILNDLLRKCEDTILSSNTTKKLLEERCEQLKKEKESITPLDYDSLIADKQKEKDDVRAELIELNQEKEKLDEIIGNKYKEYNALLETLDQTFKTRETELLDLFVKPVEITLNDTLNKLKEKERELIKLENIKDICPTCGQKIPGVHKVDTSNLKVEIDNLKQIVESSQKTKADNITMVKQELETLKHSQEIKKQADLAIVNNNIFTRDNLVAQRDTKQEVFNTLDLEYQKLKLAKETYDNKASSINNDLKDVQKSIDSICEKLLYNYKEQEEIKARLDVVSKMITLATREFRGILLQGVIDFINTKAKEYCANIFENEKIDFVLDGNNILITYNNKEYENLSGGEKQKIDLIIQFSLRDMLIQFLNFSCNILVLDEVFDNLDFLGCQKVIDLITYKLNDLNSIFIITHHENELEIAYDNKITVIKNEKGISSILR